MKIILLTAVLFVAHGEAQWRYYPIGKQDWNPWLEQRLNPQGQPPDSRYPANGNARRGNVPYPPNPWLHPDPHDALNRNNALGAEWVCQNSQTGNRVIIISYTGDSAQPGNTAQQPQWHQPQYPTWHQPPQSQQPARPEQFPCNQCQTSQDRGTSPDQSYNVWYIPFLNVNKSASTSERPAQPTSSPSIEQPVTHGGEGLIDIRLGV